MNFHYMPLVLAVVLGIVFYLVRRYVPMEPIFRTIVSIITVVLAIVLLLMTFGFIGTSHISQ